MTQREAVIQQLKALKGKPFKNKVRHIFTYYKIPILAIVLMATLTVSCVIQLDSAKRTALYVSCFGTSVVREKEESFCLALSHAVGIDQNKEQIQIATNLNLQEELYAGEALAAQIIGGMVDVLVFNEESCIQWLYQDVFADLSEMLSVEWQTEYADKLLYVDMAVLEQMDDWSGIQAPLIFPDPAKPEEMERPVPVAVRIADSNDFANVFFSDRKGSVVVGVVANAPNRENAISFLNYVIE